MKDKKIFWGQILHTPDQTKPQPVEMFPGAAPGAYRIGTRNPEFEELMGSIDDEPITDPTAEEASALGLLRGLLAALQAQAGDTNLGDLAALLTALGQKDFATQSTLAAVLAKLSDDPATQTTLEAVLTALAAIRDTAGIKKITDAVDISNRSDRVLGKVTVDDGGNQSIGSMADTAVTDSTATASVIALLKGLIKQLQGTGAGSLPIVITNSDIAAPTDLQTVYRPKVVETTTNLGASATYNSAAIDGANARRIQGFAYADQAGTLNLQDSRDGVTWRTTATHSVAAGTVVSFDEPIYAQYKRVQYVNGAAAQEAFELVAHISPN